MIVTVESRLIARAQKGDKKALDMLWRANSRHLRNFLLKRITDRGMLQDVQQQTALQFVQHVRQYNGGGRFTSWLFRIALNEWFMILRKEKKHKDCLSLDVVAPEDNDVDLARRKCLTGHLIVRGGYDIEAVVAARLQLGRIDRRIRAMRRDWRLPYWRHFVEGFQAQDIARKMHLTLGAVKSRLQRANEYMMKRLGNG